MIKIFKNKFLRKFKSLPFLIGLIFLVIFGLTLPLKPAYAFEPVTFFLIGVGILSALGALSFISSTAASISANLLAAVILFIPFLLGTIFFEIAVGFLNLVTNPKFISVSYTGRDNPVIDAGWPLVRDLANILIVLFLIVIGLATALKIEEYRAQKLLPKLIIVALLVNFSPVICGIIIDASNILMDNLLNNLKGWEALTSIFTKFGSIPGYGSISSLDTIKEFFTIPKFTGQLLGLTFYAWVGSLVIFILVIIFLVRYVALWLLVVLSPLAFVAYVLPITKKYFNLWWNQFLQWNIIGVAAAFFLYLSNQLLGNIKINPSGTFFDVLFPYFTVIVCLLVGVLLGFQTSAYGAGAIIGVAKGGWKTSARWAGSQTRALASRAAEATGLKERMQRQAAARYPGRTLLGKTAWTLGTLGAAPAFWALRRGIGEAGIYLTEAGRKDIRGAEKKYEGKIAADKVAGMRDVRLGWSNRTAALNQVIKQEDIKEAKRLMGPTADQEITAIGRAALRVHPDEFKLIRDAFPKLAQDMGKGFSETIQKQAKVNLAETLAMKDKLGKPLYSGIMERIMAEMKTAQVSKMDSSVLFGPTKIQAVFEAAQKNWQAGHWAEAGRAFGKEFCDEVRAAFLAAPQNFTPSAQKYFTASPAGKSLYGI